MNNPPTQAQQLTAHDYKTLKWQLVKTRTEHEEVDPEPATEHGSVLFRQIRIDGVVFFTWY